MRGNKHLMSRDNLFWPIGGPNAEKVMWQDQSKQQNTVRGSERTR